MEIMISASSLARAIQQVQGMSRPQTPVAATPSGDTVSISSEAKAAAAKAQAMEADGDGS
jgi:hypothetical protein